MPSSLLRAGAAVLTAAALATTTAAAIPSADAAGRHAAHRHAPRPYSFGVIGDVPYGDFLQAQFPAYIAKLNHDTRLRSVLHLGDIKSGSTTCDDARFAEIRSDFDMVRAPLVYSPGDNEWTDCHRANNGSYHPLERLATVRRMFFPTAGRTLGGRMQVTSQARRGFPENVRYIRGGLSFAALHVVGSNNDLAIWDGIGKTAPTNEQIREEDARMSATIANLRAAFRTAKRQHSKAVVLFQQADMFDPTVTDPQLSDFSAFIPLVKAMIRESNRFHGPVYLFNGDSHQFNHDRPLARSSSWPSFYGVHGSAGNLQRYTVDGSADAEKDYLRVTTRNYRRDPLKVTQVFTGLPTS